MTSATKRTGLPEIWPSSISGVLVGDKSCLLQPWIRAHYVLPKSGDFDRDGWKVKHTELLNLTVGRMEGAGWKCRIESQNFISLKGVTAILKGKPDVIGKKDSRTRVVDCKAGAIRDEHQAQVAIYCIAVPLLWKAPLLEKFIEGSVVYPDHEFVLPAGYVEMVKPSLFNLIRRLGDATAPDATPSEAECRYCQAPLELCDKRFVGETEAVDVQEF